MIVGKKRKLTRKVLVDYFGKVRCGLPLKITENNLQAIILSKESCFSLIEDSFLSAEFKKKYIALFENRLKILDLL
jgi:hypothetical protein